VPDYGTTANDDGEAAMQLGMIGLGRMGAKTTGRLIKDGHKKFVDHAELVIHS
jgi:hypothetical protein